MEPLFTKKTRLRIGDVVLQQIDDDTYVNTSDWTTIRITGSGYCLYPLPPYTSLNLVYLGHSPVGECIYGTPEGIIYLIVDEIYVPVLPSREHIRSRSPGRVRERSRSRERSRDRSSATGREQSRDRSSATEVGSKRVYTVADRRSLNNLILFLENNMKNIRSIVWYTDDDGKFRVKNKSTGESVDADLHYLLEGKYVKKYYRTPGWKYVVEHTKEHSDRCNYFSYLKHKYRCYSDNYLRFYAIFPYNLREFIKRTYPAEKVAMLEN